MSQPLVNQGLIGHFSVCDKDIISGLNANFLLLDTIVQLAADEIVSELPSSPNEGDRYILSTDKTLNTWDGTQWITYPANMGYIAYVRNENTLYVYDGSDWVNFIISQGGLIAGTNITITGSGTVLNPYIISSTAPLSSQHDEIEINAGVLERRIDAVEGVNTVIGDVSFIVPIDMDNNNSFTYLTYAMIEAALDAGFADAYPNLTLDSTLAWIAKGKLIPVNTTMSNKPIPYIWDGSRWAPDECQGHLVGVPFASYKNTSKYPLNYLPLLQDYSLLSVNYPDLADELAPFVAGANINIPDHKSIHLRGTGTQARDWGGGGSRSKVGPDVGEFQEDQMQRTTGSTGDGTVRGGDQTPPIPTGMVSLSDGGAYSYSGYSASGSSWRRRLLLDSADSPNARTSNTTDGETRVTSIGVVWVMRIF